MKHNPGFLKLVEETRTRVRECTAREVKEKLDRGESFHLLDVREESEYHQDHVVGSRHVGKGIIERDIETVIPDKQAPIVLYCGRGYRSILAADALQDMGYSNVLSMSGGVQAWREAGYSLEPGKAR